MTTPMRQFCFTLLNVNCEHVARCLSRPPLDNPSDDDELEVRTGSVGLYRVVNNRGNM